MSDLQRTSLERTCNFWRKTTYCEHRDQQDWILIGFLELYIVRIGLPNATKLSGGRSSYAFIAFLTSQWKSYGLPKDLISCFFFEIIFCYFYLMSLRALYYSKLQLSSNSPGLIRRPKRPWYSDQQAQIKIQVPISLLSFLWFLSWTKLSSSKVKSHSTRWVHWKSLWIQELHNTMFFHFQIAPF